MGAGIGESATGHTTKACVVSGCKSASILLFPRRIYQLLYKQFRIKFPCSIAEKKMKILNSSVLLALRDSFVSWI